MIYTKFWMSIPPNCCKYQLTPTFWLNQIQRKIILCLVQFTMLRKKCYLIALTIILLNIESRYNYQSGYLIMLRKKMTIVTRLIALIYWSHIDCYQWPNQKNLPTFGHGHTSSIYIQCSIFIIYEQRRGQIFNNTIFGCNKYSYHPNIL
jgi:hypothetical protein